MITARVVVRKVVYKYFLQQWTSKYLPQNSSRKYFKITPFLKGHWHFLVIKSVIVIATKYFQCYCIFLPHWNQKIVRVVAQTITLCLLCATCTWTGKMCNNRSTSAYTTILHSFLTFMLLVHKKISCLPTNYFAEFVNASVAYNYKVNREWRK